MHTWNLIPESTAKPQPDYIPEAIIEDYAEACRIRDLSPKSSATLARRCLQGMIRDFWNVKGKPNLFLEIEEIKDEVSTGTWQAIHAVRKVGKVGAHMEQDVNIIIDVEPQEVDLLIGLIEMLFEDWYVDRYERQERVKAVISLGDTKQRQMDDAAGKGSSNEDSPSVEEGTEDQA